MISRREETPAAGEGDLVLAAGVSLGGCNTKSGLLLLIKEWAEFLFAHGIFYVIRRFHAEAGTDGITIFTGHD